MAELNREMRMQARPLFSERTSVQQVEEGNTLAPKFDVNGLIICVTTDAESKEVLMVGYMNAEALAATIRTGQAHYWSRSRKALWHKGATSGLIQKVVEMRIDDDQDAVWISVSVDGNGASCHVGYRSCFYREVPATANSSLGANLIFKESKKVFDPDLIYPNVPNPTQL